MTLTEMLVVMLIFGIVVAATASVTISMSRTTGQNMARQDLVDEARTAVERVSKTTRTAVKPSQLLSSCSVACAEVDAFLQGTPTSMKFYANLDNPGNSLGPSQITYTIATSGADAGVLVEKVQRPDSNVPGTNGYAYCNAEAAGASAACRARLSVRRVAEGVTTTSDVFRYYAADGARLVPAASGLTASDLEKVLGIEVTLTVRSDSTTAPQPITYIQRITLPNAQAVMQQGEDAP
jgi:prepilin-type N-terminal cleavage/methylation domain-containing protein